MNDLTIFPAHLNELSVGQLAGLPHHQLHEVDTNLDQLIDWAKKARTRVDLLVAGFQNQAELSFLL